MIPNFVLNVPNKDGVHIEDVKEVNGEWAVQAHLSCLNCCRSWANNETGPSLWHIAE